MDFNSLSGRSSVRRKQSNSLLQAFGKPASRTSAIPISPAYATPPTASSSHFPDAHDPYSPESPYGAYGDASSSRAASSSYHVPLATSRSVSGSTGSGGGRERAGSSKEPLGGGALVRRPGDVFRIVRDRLFSWSYMMQWYQGDIHWFNTVKVSRSALEASLGPSKVDQRSRSFFLLGSSLSPLFDITNAGDYLRSLLKLLEEWENFAEHGHGRVKGLFRGQRGAKKPVSGGMSDISTGVNDTESLLLHINMPFSPDFFLTHAITCSIVRDVYKKILGMVLPSPSPPTLPAPSDPTGLFHPSTFIHSAPGSAGRTGSPADSNPLSPASGSAYSFHAGSSSHEGPTAPSPGEVDPIGLSPPRGNSSATQHDAFQALVAGELPAGRMLVGEGQSLTPQVVELFAKVDQKLRKHFSTLLREGDALARKVLDDEVALLTSSLSGGAPLKFDVIAAMSGPRGGWHGAAPIPSSAGFDNLSL